MRRSTAALAAALLLSSCNPATTPPPGAPGAPTAAGLVRIGDEAKVSYTDLATDARGGLHAIYRHQNGDRQEVRYRTSADGGATWSDAETLWKPAEPGRNAGLVVIGTDAADRVYAFWVSDLGTDGFLGNAAGGWNYPGTLQYRVKEAGGWGAPVAVGAPDGVFSWFVAGDAQGGVSVFWLEDAVAPGVILNHRPGVLKRAAVDGAALGPARELRRTTATEDVLGLDYDMYEGLRGFLAADGALHWAAFKSPAHEAATGQALVYGVDDREVVLTKTGMLGLQGFGDDPPLVFQDAAGRDHVVVRDKGRERQSAVDYVIGADGTPTPVRPAAEPTGELLGVQGFAAAGGRALVFSSLKDAAGAAYDLQLSIFDGTGWREAANVTANAARETSTTKVPTVTTYSPVWASGALAAGGGTHVLTSMMEKTAMAAGSVGARHLYYGRTP